MTLKQDYIEREGTGRTVTAAAMLVRDLMRGDPDEMKVGYTRENAILAAIDVFGAAELATAALEKELLFT